MKKLKHVSIVVLLFVALLTVMVGLGINAFSSEGATADSVCEHNYSETNSATCTEAGVKTFTCELCGDVYTEVADALGHNFIGTKTDATCVEKGAWVYTCSTCGSTFSEEIAIDPENHTEATREENRVEATCGADGSYDLVTYCSLCEKVLNTEAKTIDATGEHVYEELRKTPATCSEKGERIDICTVCEFENKVVLDEDPSNHVGETEIRDAVTPTCAKDGYKGDTYCLSCEAKIVTGTVIPATGDHVYATEVTRVESTCTTAGYVINECACGATEKTDFELDATNHADYETELRDYVAETCGKDGYEGDKYCLGCQRVAKKGDVIPATGDHVYATEVTRVESTCTTAGYVINECACGATEKTDFELDATNHADYGTVVLNVKAETCVDAGYTGDICCKGCNAVLEAGKVLAATGNHNYVSAVTKVANCYEAGVKTFICSTCNDFYTEALEIDAENHVGGTELRNFVEETCAKDGYSGDTYCLGCEAVLEKGAVVAATGNHDYKEKIITAATCIAEGKKEFTCSVCEKTYEEAIAIDSANHVGKTEIRDDKAENCGVDGYTGDTYCLDCEAKIADGEVISATGNHTFTDKVTKIAMCNETGIRTYTCSVCEYTKDEIIEKDPTNHTGNTDIRDVVVGNCGKNGYTGNLHCSDCEAVLEYGEIVDSTNEHSYVSAVTKEPTCCEFGERTYICSICNNFYTETIKEKNPLNHSGGTEIRGYVAETCGADGYSGDKHCLGCGEMLISGNVINATGLHTFESEITTPATCVAFGVKTYTCTVCKGYYTEPVAMNPENHTGRTDIRGYIAETCGADGFTGNTHCSDCNEKLADGTVIPATGNHTFTSAVTKVAMCNETGIRTYTCSVCAYTYDEIIAKDPANHTGVTELRDVKAETCGMNGYTGDTYCKDCDTKLVLGEVIPATGKHNHIAMITKPATCIETGVITITCKDCGDTYYETIEIDATNHVGETLILGYVAETCGAEGFSGDVYCLDCEEKIADGEVIPATGNHTFESEITLVPTCCEKGERTYICSVCEFTKTEEVEFDAENHADYGTEIRNDSEPKCIIKGYTGDICCVGCGEILETGEEIPETGKHDYASEITTAATCCNTGVRTYTCIVCEDSFTEEVAKDAMNHEGETEIRNAKDATCVSAGYTGNTHCKGCGAKLADGKEVEKTAHTEVEVKGKDATCKATGLTSGTKCSVCDTVIKAQTVIAKLEHKFGEWTLVKAPTTAEEGQEERVCSVCQKAEIRDVEKLSFEPGDVNGDGQVNAADARLVLRISASLETLESVGTTLVVADMNGDGKVNAADARLVLRKAAKLD